MNLKGSDVKNILGLEKKLINKIIQSHLQNIEKNYNCFK